MRMNSIKKRANQAWTFKRELIKQTMNLLLVDDDDIALLHYRKMADSSGLFSSIRSATNGLTALHILNQTEEGVFPVPDVILLDLDMPVINGITFLKLLEKWNVPRKEQMSIIVMIDDLTEERRDAIRELGIKYFLTKPLSFDSFKDMVEIISTHRSPIAKLMSD